MTYLIDRTHYNMYLEIDDGEKWAFSRVPSRWFEAIDSSDSSTADLLIKYNLNKRVDRSVLKNLCMNDKVPHEICALAILAWGGMRVSHGKAIWERRSDWVSIVENLRHGKIDRKDAYYRFRCFRNNNPGCGMGPAYYTKLIFFASPRHDGYIMDQWTSRSVNLLFESHGSPIVDLSKTKNGNIVSYRVTDKNTKEDYERFCGAIEYLAEQAEIKAKNLSPEDVEVKMFSYGGANPGGWRRYVVNSAASHDK